MTPQQRIQEMKPISMDGKVLLDKSDFDAVQDACTDIRALPAIMKAKANHAKTGVELDSNEFFSKIRKKYVK